MNDGSRHFGELPHTKMWYGVRDHIKKLAGADLTDFITDHVTEAWIDFSYRHHRFSINDQFGAYWFFVNDPRVQTRFLKRYCRILSFCSERLMSELILIQPALERTVR